MPQLADKPYGKIYTVDMQAGQCCRWSSSLPKCSNGRLKELAIAQMKAGETVCLVQMYTSQQP